MGKDTFITLPTGYGKSKIYQHLPEILQAVSGEKASVVVISPLQALMQDQVHKLEELSIPAVVVGEVQKDKGVGLKIQNGCYDLVFSSPEAILTAGLWRKSITSGVFHENVKAVVIDEAHCITEWGGEFRTCYSRLNELRSIFPEKTPFVALTATATVKMRTEIMEKLDMTFSNTVTVSVVPDRSNITYYVFKTNKNKSDLDWLVEEMKSSGPATEKTIIYCRNIASCADLYEHFSNQLLQNQLDLDSRRIAMYHRSTADINKNHVISNFPKSDSNLRLVIATIAFGMGVDIADVSRVIHWGAPRGIEQFSQESGRAGRDERPSVSIVYFSCFDIAKNRSKESVREFCTTTGCLRDVLISHFKLQDNETDECAKKRLCRCCLNCKLNCQCGNCLELPNAKRNSLESDIDSCNSFVEIDRALLRDNLYDFHEYLLEEGNERHLLFDSEMIDSIVESVDFIFCADDIISLGLIDHHLAEEIFELVNEV